jgi:hypothetical protein
MRPPARESCRAIVAQAPHIGHARALLKRDGPELRPGLPQRVVDLIRDLLRLLPALLVARLHVEHDDCTSRARPLGEVAAGFDDRFEQDRRGVGLPDQLVDPLVDIVGDRGEGDDRDRGLAELDQRNRRIRACRSYLADESGERVTDVANVLVGSFGRSRRGARSSGDQSQA